jgi:hypothetical protein
VDLARHFLSIPVCAEQQGPAVTYPPSPLLTLSVTFSAADNRNLVIVDGGAFQLSSGIAS